MAKQFVGQTESGAFLGADFWKKGTRLEGQVIDRFKTQNGDCYGIRLTNPRSVMVNGKKEEVVAIGALKGFNMAIRASGAGDLQPGDGVIVECIGMEDTGKESKMVKFKVAVSREDF